MARLIPEQRVEEIDNDGERAVAKVLVDLLPDECLAYHSQPWLRPDRDRIDGHTVIKYRQGESDFVVVIPGLGFLVIEVKGGEVSRRDGQWLTRARDGNEYRIKDPFKQAEANRFALMDELVHRHYHDKYSIPFSHGYLVVFPYSDYEGAVPGADDAMIVGASQLKYLDEISRTVLRRFKPDAKMDKEDINKLKAVLQPHFNLVRALKPVIDHESEVLKRITDNQAAALDFLGSCERAAIRGVAGAGKTLLAMRQATHFAEQGLDTLFLCYNKALAEYLRLTLTDTLPGNITIRHFHGLCDEWCKRAEIPFDPPVTDADSFWRERAPELLLEATASVEDRFDAIVVDEAQDYLMDWWAPIEEINRGNRLYVFYDPDQDLYSRGQGGLPSGLGGPFELNRNCRNTVAITRAASGILGRDITNWDGAPEGTAPERIVAETDDEQRAAVGDVLAKWCSGESGLEYSKVAILSPRRIDKGPLAEVERINGVPIVHDIESWLAGKGVFAHTMQGFKGLEAQAAIIIDYRTPDADTWRTINYVGISRACNLLAFVTRDTH